MDRTSDLSINLELYRLFAAVASAGSFSQAASQLGLTQSAVSQSVKQLEGLLKTQLFIRTGKGAVLTEAGVILYGKTAALIEGVLSAERYFTQLQNLESGSLNIGASDSLCRYLLLDSMRAFKEKYPGIRISVTNRTSGETIGLLKSGKADIGFVNMPVEGAADFEVVEIAQVRECFVCGAGTDFPSRAAPEELNGLPLMMLERLSAGRRFVDCFFKKMGITLKPQIELGSLDLLCDFARAGLGVACVVEEFTDISPGSGLRKIDTVELPFRSVAMLKNKSVPYSFALKEYIKILRPAL